MHLRIHPAIGIARVGNSPDQFYLEPETIGGRPIECAPTGEPVMSGGDPKAVETFKDARGRVKRQAARFRVFASDGPGAEGRPVVVGRDIRAMEWTVHLANKKAVWYNFTPFVGDLMLPPPPGRPDNSYKSWEEKLRNADYKGDRRNLIIDPGPRSLSTLGTRAEFSKGTIPASYKYGRFPEPPTQGLPITTLGSMLMDPEGALLVLGGFGRAGGRQSITGFAGADSWFDDVADGSVCCRVKLNDGKEVRLQAWVVVGSPKFAPELVNIVTLDDILFDVAVRHLQLAPKLYDPAHFSTTENWNPKYVANYERDVEPLFKRIRGYPWVANVPAMAGFAAPPFDPRDNSPKTAAARRRYFSHWRKPGPHELAADGQQNVLLGPGRLPLMPLNSGSNPVTEKMINKFLTLTPTQYFLLHQWAEGHFDTGPTDWFGLNPLDRATVGNAVGSPMCPGIEVTWNTRNPRIYAGAYRIAHHEADYAATGLSPDRDETEGGGCQPGDLTKRMAIPWQADFFACGAQFINFTDPDKNKDDGIPVPPTYYAYWWPPQSPLFVMTPMMDAADQRRAGVPSGFQVYYTRGLNSFADMITGWSHLGFVANRATGLDRGDYPTYEEVERNHDRFIATSVAVGGPDNFVNNTDTYFTPMWFLKAEPAYGPPGGGEVGHEGHGLLSAEHGAGEVAAPEEGGGGVRERGPSAESLAADTPLPVRASGISRTNRNEH